MLFTTIKTKYFHECIMVKGLLAGPSAKQVKKDQFVIFPGDKGIVGIQKGGKTVIFLNEERIFGICSPYKSIKE